MHLHSHRGLGDIGFFLKLCKDDAICLLIFFEHVRDLKWESEKLETCYDLDELVTDLIS